MFPQSRGAAGRCLAVDAASLWRFKVARNCRHGHSGRPLAQSLRPDETSACRKPVCRDSGLGAVCGLHTVGPRDCRGELSLRPQKTILPIKRETRAPVVDASQSEVCRILCALLPVTPHQVVYPTDGVAFGWGEPETRAPCRRGGLAGRLWHDWAQRASVVSPPQMIFRSGHGHYGGREATPAAECHEHGLRRPRHQCEQQTVPSRQSARGGSTAARAAKSRQRCQEAA